MNKLERIIYLPISEYPLLRIPLVNAYQRIFSLLPTKNFIVDQEIIILNGYFFGFHDKCPWAYDNSMVLAHQFDKNKSIKIIEKIPIKIGFFNRLRPPIFNEIGTSSTWNWQQGAGLQWIGRTKKIIYNDCDNGRNVAKVIDLKGRLINVLPGHIASLCNSGKYALMYSYDRLGCGMNGYGYKYANSKNSKIGKENNEALSIIDVETNQKTKLFYLNDIINIDYEKTMNKAYHFFSHCLFSKDDNRFVFFHRWLLPSGRLNTRMFSSDASGKRLFLFSGSQFSHIAWKNSEYIFAYCRPKNKNLGLYLLKDGADESTRVAKDFIESDGHPQISFNKRYILIDTYPDRYRCQFIKIYDIEKKAGTILAKLRIPFKYRLTKRCDFHPRWNRDDTMICFDSAHTGTRSLCFMRNMCDFRESNT